MSDDAIVMCVADAAQSAFDAYGIKLQMVVTLCAHEDESAHADDNSDAPCYEKAPVDLDAVRKSVSTDNAVSPTAYLAISTHLKVSVGELARQIADADATGKQCIHGCVFNVTSWPDAKEVSLKHRAINWRACFKKTPECAGSSSTSGQTIESEQ